MQVEVQVQDRVIKDEVEWDMDDPQNTAFSYAHALCSDLGLGCDFAAAIMKAVETQLGAKREVRDVAFIALVMHAMMHQSNF